MPLTDLPIPNFLLRLYQKRQKATETFIKTLAINKFSNKIQASDEICSGRLNDTTLRP